MHVWLQGHVLLGGMHGLVMALLPDIHPQAILRVLRRNFIAVSIMEINQSKSTGNCGVGLRYRHCGRDLVSVCSSPPTETNWVLVL
jgi:hypothetical protein